MKVNVYATTKYIFVENFKGKNYKVVESYDENSDSYDFSVFYGNSDKEVEGELKEEILKAIEKKY